MNTSAGKTVKADALELLAHTADQPGKNHYTIAYVDPPYAMNCALQCCQLLADNKWLANEAYIYIESADAISENDLPANWRLHRQKKAGNVNYHLAIQQL